MIYMSIFLDMRTKEDCLLTTCAITNPCDAIVIRNKQDFLPLGILLTPEEGLEGFEMIFLIGRATALLTPFFGYAIIFSECSRTKGYTTTGVVFLRAFFLRLFFTDSAGGDIYFNCICEREIFEIDFM